jgi:alpha-L-fucosidase
MEEDDKPIEICTTIHPDKVWGYSAAEAENHKTAEDVWEILRKARGRKANLLLNVGPRADGSIDPRHEKVLREVGARLRKEGFPDGE